jgi:NAD+ diphosphatase
MFELLAAAEDHHHRGRVWCITRGSEVLVRAGAAEPLLAEDVAGTRDQPPPADAQFLGVLAGRPIWARGLPRDAPAPPGHEYVPLRQLPARFDEDAWMLGARAVQLVEWARSHRFCGACGTATAAAPRERAMVCPSCGLMAFPRLSPAVIMVVHRGPDLLLAHGRAAPRPVYGPLAGFVEVGETLEHAVRREVREEVGVEIGAVEYVTSQSWPFPNSLMIGFFAEYLGGDIRVDPAEIVDARWFTPAEIPRYPDDFVISSRLVRAHLERVADGRA